MARGRWIPLLMLLLCARSARAGVDPDEMFFEAKIRPVLAGTCFACHGDTQTSGELRVDSRAALLQGGASGPAIVPGNAEQSLLIHAIQRRDDVSVMPPDAEKALRADQIADFVSWINSGAVWPESSARFETGRHWAYLPLRDEPPPQVRDVDWLQTSVDAFVRSRLESANVAPARPADKLALIRRATFDLTGLPPTPAEIDAFLQDDRPEAFATVIDRLLASPAYGEHWGRHWLDIVRYADTAGETADYPVPLAWRYRNYVIDAFNSDKPYDAFLCEQIAGDILAADEPRERYAELATATGFLAISRRFGFDSENYHHLTIQDTIDTLGQSVLGLTLGCARCHDHKFDAVSMTDYYGLYGIFDSSRYAFPGSEQKQKTRAMLPLIPPEESQASWHAFNVQVAALTAQLEQQQQPAPNAVLRSLHDMDGDFELQAPAAGGSNGVLVPPWLYEGRIAVTTEAQSPFKHLYAKGRVGASVPAGDSPYRIEQSLHRHRLPPSASTVYVHLDFRTAAAAEGTTGAHRFWLGDTPDMPAVEVLIASNSVVLRTGETVEQIATLPPQTWINLQLAIDVSNRTVAGTIGAPGQHSEFAARPLSASWSGGLEELVLDSGGDASGLRPAIEFDNLGVQFTPLLPVTDVAPAPLTDGSKTADELGQMLQSLLADGPCAMTYGIAEGTPHNVRMQLRGEPDQLGIEVPRGFVRVLGGGPLPPETQGSGRLELARWLTGPDNPLAARVIVNRIWQHHFGQGLVRTPNDFGVRGLPPTHPELLDHLARRFIKGGWSIKSLQRQILLSATYQQSSDIGDLPRPAATDLYASFPRRRLSAEQIRDAVLAVSGELDPTPGLGHPFPTPVNWGYTQHGPYSAVYDHNHRSVYLMTQRLKRHPFLALFDGADPNASTADRLETTVPTQALYFLNDPFIHTSVERWATRLQALWPDEAQQVSLAWRTAMGRAPTGIEANEAAEFLEDYRRELAALQVDNIEVRSLAAYLRTLIGSNEFLYVD
ncbi:MAG: PSD1 domain-containing protein [Planctomycetaceae bacterium]|nr:PSD1 domain-containing protein [Planctomycetaceae bacterium]